MLKSELDALLQRLPQALVVRATGSTGGGVIELSCSANRSRIAPREKGMQVPQHDSRLSSLEFLPRIAELIQRSDVAVDQKSVSEISTPQPISLTSPAGNVKMEVRQIEAERLQSLLRDVIASLAGGGTGRKRAADKILDEIIVQMLRQMRHVLGRPGATQRARPLGEWGIKAMGSGRKQYQIGSGRIISRRQYQNALKQAEAHDLIARSRKAGNQDEYMPTKLGLARAEAAACLSLLQSELRRRMVTVAVMPGGRVAFSAPATSRLRARKWFDQLPVVAADDARPCTPQRRIVKPRRSAKTRKTGKLRGQRRAPHRG
jgi:hypothetical protein